MVNHKVGSKLTDEEKRALLDIARQVVAAAVTGEKASFEPYAFDVFKEKRGVFVTLHRHGKLRGCIGYVIPYCPLQQAVEEMARAAAMRDPRFHRVKADELPEIDIEVSVLSPLRRVEDVQEIEVGVHGLYIKKGPYSGLLLPQVAPQYGWDREQFLQQTCLKAGLPTTAWQDEDAEIWLFSAEVFGENDDNMQPSANP
jgi:AmmeMemoRadiSam system protein A